MKNTKYALDEMTEQVNNNLGRVARQVHLLKLLLVLLDEDLSLGLQAGSVVEVCEDIKLHHVLHGQHPDGCLLGDKHERRQIIEARQVEEAGQVDLESLLRNTPRVEILHEVTDHLITVLDSGLVLLVLLHLDGHHGEHDGRLGSQDQSVTGELLPVLAQDGEVREEPVIVVPQHGRDISLEIELGASFPKITASSIQTKKKRPLFFPTNLSYKSFLQNFPIFSSYKPFLQKYSTWTYLSVISTSTLKMSPWSSAHFLYAT